jgi:DMSO/TMAO reductase YedYZ molybdopterin-dependent catalytic subunit
LLQAGEELVEFADYTDEFQVEAQKSRPRVKCFDLRRLTAWATPNQEFFAFHQSEAARADAGSWRLRVGGAVEHPAEFTLEELHRQDRQEVAAVVECSGNSGHPQLMNGLVSNAAWSGAGLASILKKCGVRPEAREVVFFGLDTEKEARWQAGGAEYLSPYGRSIHVQDAVSPEPLLAYEMNGAPLPAEHGFPLRLVLPGWYGMAQVKWLSGIEVLDRRYEGRHMARNYHSLRALETPEGTLWLDTSISRNNLKSVVARVTRRPAKAEYRIAGAAWGGRAPIAGVEVRVDSGEWRPARIDERRAQFGWLLWSLEWREPAPGRHTLVSRAIDAAGMVQPTREEWRKRVASNREDHSQWPRIVVLP